MLNILVVDDLPGLKTNFAFDYLRYHDRLELNCEYVTDVNSANRYIKEKANEISFIILDLGLPILKNGDLAPLNGLMVLQFMKHYKINIPVIIVSTTEIPNEDELIEDLKEVGINMTHLKALDQYWLSHFVKFDLN